MNSRSTKAELIVYLCGLSGRVDGNILRVWLTRYTRKELYRRAQEMAMRHRLAASRAALPVVELKEPVYQDSDD